MPLPTLLIPGSITGTTELPINVITSWIKSRMYEFGYKSANMNDRVLIIQAKTGTGKSTIIPVELFRILRNKNISLSIRYTGKKVICTQPRVLTAIELARDVSSKDYNPDLKLGVTVGYQSRPATEKPKNGLIYATLGILSKQLSVMSDEDFINLYKFIIIDEAHERTMESDMTLLMLQHLYLRNIGNKDLPFLILTSATIDVDKYARYFGLTKKNTFFVTGSSFYIEDNWASYDVSNIYNYINDIVINICKDSKDKQGKNDILIFMPGAKEQKEIKKLLEKADLDALILILNKDEVESNSSDYRNIFEKYDKLPLIKNKIPFRRIIITTSVAETGLTIETCKYVIDNGYHRAKEGYPIINASGLITKPAPQSRIIQRRGRVGRQFDGEFYASYTKETFESLEKQQLPEIMSVHTEYMRYHLSLHNLYPKFNIYDVKLLDPPPMETFINANAVSTILGFVDNNSELTKLGKIASKFVYITMEQAKIIFSGFHYNTSILDLITICAFMKIHRNELFTMTNKYKKYLSENNMTFNTEIPCCDSYTLPDVLPNFISKDGLFYFKYKILFCDEFIESLYIFESYVKAISKYKYPSLIKKWCYDNAIEYTKLNLVYLEREIIIEELLIAGIDIFYNHEKSLIYQNTQDTFIEAIINIKKCLYEGLKCNLLIYDSNSNKYKTLNGVEIEVTSNILSNVVQNKLINMKIIKEEIKPKFLITDNITITKLKGDSTLYNLSINYISVLDGYVYPDIYIGDPYYT